MSIVHFYQNGLEISEMDARAMTVADYHKRGYADQSDFNETWSQAKQDSELGEIARDRIFEWSDCTLEIEVY